MRFQAFSLFVAIFIMHYALHASSSKHPNSTQNKSFLPPIVSAQRSSHIATSPTHEPECNESNDGEAQDSGLMRRKHEQYQQRHAPRPTSTNIKQ